MTPFRDSTVCEGFDSRTSSLIMPNGSIVATTDWDLSNVMARSVLAAWAEHPAKGESE